MGHSQHLRNNVTEESELRSPSTVFPKRQHHEYKRFVLSTRFDLPRILGTSTSTTYLLIL